MLVEHNIHVIQQYHTHMRCCIFCISRIGTLVHPLQMSYGFQQSSYWWECSSHNKVRELGSKRCKSVWSISVTIMAGPKALMQVLFAQYARTSNKLLKLNFVIQWYHCFQISDYQTFWPPVCKDNIRQRDQPAIIFISNSG